MSSVNSGDDVKKVREYYQKREEELKAAHAKEKKKISEAQKANLDKASASTDQIGKQGREATHAAITQSDMKHANDIERVKALHSKQLREQMEGQNKEQENLKKVYKENISRTEKMNAQERRQKDAHALKVNQDQQQKLEQTISSYNQRNKDNSGEFKQKITSKHEKSEKESLARQTAEREELIGQMNDIKAQKNREEQRLKNNQRYEKEKLDNAHQKVLSQQQMDNANVLEDMRELHIEGVDKERKQYNKALKEERERMAIAREDMQRGPGSKKVAELNDKIAAMEKHNARQLQKNERAKNREVDNVKMSYEDSIEVLQKQKKAMLEQNGQSRSELQAAIEKKANQEVQSSRDYFQSRMDEETDHNDRTLTRMQKRMQKDSAQKAALDDLRFKKIRDEMGGAQEVLQKKQNMSLDALKEQHEQSLAKVRQENVQERKVMQESYEGQLAKMQVRQAEEMDKIKRDHDSMVAQLRLDFEAQAQDSNKKIRTASSEKDKTKDSEVKAKEAQFEYRLKKMEEAYNDSLKRISNQHEESVRTLKGKEGGRGRYA